MRYLSFFSAWSSSSRESWPLAIGSAPRMSRATSPSAIPFTSSGCRPQKSAIWSKVSEVLSTSQTAVALGIRMSVMGEVSVRKIRGSETKAPGLSAGRVCPFYRPEWGRREPLAAENPAVVQGAHLHAHQDHLSAAGHVDHRVGAHLGHRIDRARVELDVVALRLGEAQRPVDARVAEGVEGVGAGAALEGVEAAV